MHQGDANRAFDPDLEIRELERSGHDLLDALGRLQRIFHAAAKRNEYAELVAASAGEDVAGPKRQDQPPSEGNKQLVTGEAAHRLVDSAEPQHVDDQHRMLEIA